MRIRSTSPLTGEVLDSFEPPTSTEFATVASRAARFTPMFAGTDLDERLRLIENLRAVLGNELPRIVACINSTVGKPLADCRDEVLDIVAGVDMYLRRGGELHEMLRSVPVDGFAQEAELTFAYRPAGTVGLIMPWNFPFWMPMGFVVPALMAGNPVVLKPSPHASPVGDLIGNLIRLAGFDSRCLQVVHGDAIVGNMIVNSPEIKKVAFVGSTTVGLNIAQQRVTQRSNNFTLEMGGNSAAIVCDDADVDNAVASIFWNGTYFAGQICTGVKRVLVHESLMPEVRRRLVALANKYNSPDLLVERIGAIITEAMLDLIEYRVERAVAVRNRVLTGGRRMPRADLPAANRNGHFFPITVVEIAHRDTDLVMKETFAPVLPLIPFQSLHEAAAIAGESEFALSANVFSQSERSIEYLLTNLNAGMFFINDSEVAYPGGNFWKGHGQSYVSTSGDDRLLGMYERRLVWRKDPAVRREYWFG